MAHTLVQRWNHSWLPRWWWWWCKCKLGIPVHLFLSLRNRQCDSRCCCCFVQSVRIVCWLGDSDDARWLKLMRSGQQQQKQQFLSEQLLPRCLRFLSRRQPTTADDDSPQSASASTSVLWLATIFGTFTRGADTHLVQKRNTLDTVLSFVGAKKVSQSVHRQVLVAFCFCSVCVLSPHHYPPPFFCSISIVIFSFLVSCLVFFSHYFSFLLPS